MKKLMFAVFAALSFAVLAQDAEGPKEGPREGIRQRAMSRPQMGGMMGDGMVRDPVVSAVTNPKVAEKIGLSQETRDQIKKIDAENRDKVRDLQAKTRAAMKNQAQLMKAEKIDEAAVMAAIDALFDCRKEMAKSQTKRLIAVKALLTPEQLEKAVATMEELRKERAGKRRGGPDRGKKPGCEGEGCPLDAGKPVPPAAAK